MKKAAHHRHLHPHKDARAVLAFVILLVAVTVLALFYMNQEMLLQYGKIKSFALLATVFMGLLVYLLYLANNETSTKKKSRSR